MLRMQRSMRKSTCPQRRPPAQACLLPDRSHFVYAIYVCVHGQVANFAPVHKELVEQDLKVTTGAIPAELRCGYNRVACSHIRAAKHQRNVSWVFCCMARICLLWVFAVGRDMASASIRACAQHEHARQRFPPGWDGVLWLLHET